jgi:futalosine hydrolase
MEGAAVFYTCNIMNTPSIQIRSVSNHIEPRNKANWNIPLAIKALNDYLIEFIQEYYKRMTTKYLLYTLSTCDSLCS